MMPQQRTNIHDDCRVGVESKEIDRLICTPRCSSRTYSYAKICFLAAAFLVAFVLGVLYMYSKFEFCPASYPVIDNDMKENAVLPRQTSTLTDWGHSTRFRGWVDVQNQGVPNDYARYVGPNDKYRFVWFSIARAGSTEQHTQPGLYEEHNGIVKRTLVKPRQIIPDIDKLGLSNYFKGWVDVQNQGVANDYAYYVDATDDIPFPWLTVALAGSSQLRTCVGLFEEKYGIVRPTLREIYYKQGINISCQYLEFMIQEFTRTSSNYDPHKINPSTSYSRFDIHQVVTENRPSKHTSSTTSVPLRKQPQARDTYSVIVSDFVYSNSSFITLNVAFLIVMIVFVALRYTF